jgi:hypothetical protein
VASSFCGPGLGRGPRGVPRRRCGCRTDVCWRRVVVRAVSCPAGERKRQKGMCAQRNLGTRLIKEACPARWCMCKRRRGAGNEGQQRSDAPHVKRRSAASELYAQRYIEQSCQPASQPAKARGCKAEQRAAVTFCQSAVCLPPMQAEAVLSAAQADRVAARQDMGAGASPWCLDPTAIPGLGVLWAQGIEQDPGSRIPGVYTPKQRSEFSH